MIRRVFIAALALLAIDAGSADAGRTGGRGGHGGGGHHGGSRGGGSRGGGSRSHRGHGRSSHVHTSSSCVEASTILGYRRCSSFGDWAKTTLLPPTAIEVGAISRAIRLAPLSLSGSTELEGQKLRFMAERPNARTMNTIGVGVRLTMDIGAGFYLGADGEIGAATASLPVRAMASDAEPLTAYQASYGQVAAILGAHRTIGDTRVAAEVAAGGLVTPVTARFADDPETGSDHRTMLSLSARPTAEARLRVARWLSPWTSVGVFAGIDLSGGGFSAGLSFGAHLRAFDGGR